MASGYRGSMPALDRGSIVEKSERSCPYCLELIKVEAIKCKHCSTSLLTGTASGEPPKKQRKPIWPWFVLIPLLLVLAVLVFGQPTEKSNASAAIDLCWERHDDPLLSSDEKMLFTITCRVLIEKYESKYGRSSSLRRQ